MRYKLLLAIAPRGLTCCYAFECLTLCWRAGTARTTPFSPADVRRLCLPPLLL
jgi:hypothetical protein